MPRLLDNRTPPHVRNRWKGAAALHPSRPDPARTVGSLLLCGAVVLAVLACPATRSRAQSDSVPSNGAVPASADPGTLRRYEQYALTHPGNAARGRELFRDERNNKCLSCHRVDGEGGDVGPDLSGISGKFDRPHLIESLLEPSRQIVEGYRTTVVELRDGRLESGIVKGQSAQQLTLMDAAGKLKVIPIVDIADRVDGPLSLMPSGLWEHLSEEQFTDLIAYLETLLGPNKPKMGAGVVGAITLPEGFAIRTVATGITGATALQTLPDGRILVCEQTGSLRVIQDGRLLAEPMLSVVVDSYWERGLIGVTVDPDFPTVPFVYVCYVAPEPYPHHRVSRFLVEGNRAVPGSEQILLRGDDQRTLGGKVPAGHQGGALHFGPDGKLYVGIGEQTAETPAQSLKSLQGKILRINPDGSIPADNPFYTATTGKYRTVWALGCRNPFTFAFDRASGLMYVNDVGGKYEEINVGGAGANFGWPAVDHGGPHLPDFSGPIHIYPQSSIAGGDFCPPASNWPAEYRGRYFFADFVLGWLKTIDPQNHRDVRLFLQGIRRPTDLRFAADGSLYVLLRNAWVIDEKFHTGTGTLMQLRYLGQ